MNVKMKNISQAEVLVLKEQIAYQEGQVVGKTLAQNDALSITLFSFAKGEEISTHESGGDAFVTCLDGVGKITIDGVDYLLHEGESIVMPAGHPHAVHGEEAFKMLLMVCWICLYKSTRNFKRLTRGVVGLAVEPNVIILRNFQTLRFAQAIAVANIVRNAVLTFPASHLNFLLSCRGSSFSLHSYYNTSSLKNKAFAKIFHKKYLKC